MRVRIHMTSGQAVDAEQYSPDNGATWLPIEVAHVVAAMAAEEGFTVVRDVLTDQWRAFRNARIESIGPAGDIEQVIEAEVERRIQERLAGELPGRIKAVAPEVERPTGPPDPPQAPEPPPFEPGDEPGRPDDPGKPDNPGRAASPAALGPI